MDYNKFLKGEIDMEEIIGYYEDTYEEHNMGFDQWLEHFFVLQIMKKLAEHEACIGFLKNLMTNHGCTFDKAVHLLAISRGYEASKSEMEIYRQGIACSRADRYDAMVKVIKDVYNAIDEFFENNSADSLS